MNLISFKQATDRNTKCNWVSVLGVDILFSYETPVAFSCSGYGRYRRRNVWGPTTGRHLRETDAYNWPEVEGPEFERHMNAAILGQMRKDQQLVRELIASAVAAQIVGIELS